MDEVRDELGDLLKPFWECIIEVKNENLLSLFESSWKIYLKEEANT